MEEVSKEELLMILRSFQKDKSLGPNGLFVELFLGCFYFIGEDLRKVVYVDIMVVAGGINLHV